MAAFLENKASSFPIIKTEPKWDHYEIEYIPSTNLKQNRAEPQLVVLEKPKVIQTERSEHIVDFSNLNSYRSTEFASKQLKVSVKTENSESKNKVGKDWKIKNEEVDIKKDDLMENKNKSTEFSFKQLKTPAKTENSESKRSIPKSPEITYDNWKIKNEAVDIKEDDLMENKNKYTEFASNQLKISVITENIEYKSKVYKCPEIACDGWKIKNEEVDIQKEDLMGNTNNISSGYVNQESGFANQEKHDGYKMYKCHLCDYQTPRFGVIMQHVWIHKKTEADLFECDKCDYVTPCKAFLKNHAVKHKNSEELGLFRCDKCKYRTRIKCNLNQHLVRHQSPKEVNLFRCDKCEYVTLHKSLSKRHALKHKIPEELFRCDKCEYVSRYKSLLKRHALKHKTPEEY